MGIHFVNVLTKNLDKYMPMYTMYLQTHKLCRTKGIRDMRKNEKKYMIGLLTQISKHGKGVLCKNNLCVIMYVWYIQNWT